MAGWLMKSEPETFGWDDLVRDGSAEWDGVRSRAASAYLKAMAVGDEAFFYHSGAKQRAVVGIMRVARAAAPDPTDAAWVSVRVEPVRPVPKPVTLAEIKAEPSLSEMKIVRQSRLSVCPVSDDEWETLLRMADAS